MKIFRFLLIVASSAVFSFCGKNESSELNGNGFYLQEQRILSLKSAFLGGSSPSPDKSSFRLYLYEKKYSKQPGWKQVSASFEVGSTRYNDKDYTAQGSDIESIIIRFPQSISGLGNGITLFMGDGKYKGNCELVNNVHILQYDVSVSKGSQIHIEILLTDGRILSIKYNGKTYADDRV